jgi:hypothetical protein
MPACGRIAPRNAEVEVGIEGGKLVAGARKATTTTPPPTHPPRSDSSRASATPGAEPEGENDETWLARLSREWPRLDIPAEIEAAKRKHPTGFDRPWFEGKWLPHAKPRIASAPRPAFASHVKPQALPEPAGWQTEAEGTNYGPGGAFPAQTWAELPHDVQKLFTDRLRARPAAHA